MFKVYGRHMLCKVLVADGDEGRKLRCWRRVWDDQYPPNVDGVELLPSRRLNYLFGHWWTNKSSWFLMFFSRPFPIVIDDFLIHLPTCSPFQNMIDFSGKIPNFTLFPSMFCLWIPMKFRWVPDFPRLFGCFHACFKVWSPRFSTDFSVVLGDFGQVNVGVAGVLVRPQPSTPGFASPPTAPSAAPRRSSRGASWRPVRRPAAAMAVLGDGLTGSLTWWPTQVGDWDGELWGSWDFFFGSGMIHSCDLFWSTYFGKDGKS